jgi:hypothetical protein
MDGEPFAQQLDGRALSVDPGMHEFAFAADGVVFATQKIMIVQGQRNRFITALLRAGGGKSRRMVAEAPAEKTAKKVAKADDDESESVPATKTSSKTAAAMVDAKSNDEEESKPEEAPKKSGSVLPYVFTGLGIASLGAGAALTYWGLKDNDRMKTECSPNCLPATVQHVKTLYLASDIALGVGVAALAAAYWTHVMNRHAEEKGTEEALRVGVAPTNSGGFASVSGTF